MALSRNADEFQCVFKSGRDCFTNFQAVVECRSADSRKNESIQTAIQFDGGALEQIVNLAFMISTHSKGLIGISFIESFPFFIQQLRCYPYDKFAMVPQDIDYGQNFLISTCNPVMPYAGFNDSEWHPELKAYLIERGISLGTFYGAFNESRDLRCQSRSQRASSVSNTKKIIELSPSPHSSSISQNEKRNTPSPSQYLPTVSDAGEISAPTPSRPASSVF